MEASLSLRSSGVQGVRGVQEENGRIGVRGVGRARLPPALGVSRRLALFDGKGDLLRLNARRAAHKTVQLYTGGVTYTTAPTSPSPIGKRSIVIPRLRRTSRHAFRPESSQALCTEIPARPLDSSGASPYQDGDPFGLASEAALHESIDKSVVETLFIDSIDLMH
jgi:hypothetical protein